VSIWLRRQVAHVHLIERVHGLLPAVDWGAMMAPSCVQHTATTAWIGRCFSWVAWRLQLEDAISSHWCSSGGLVQFEAASLSLVLTWSWSSLLYAVHNWCTLCIPHPPVTKLHFVLACCM